MSGRPLWIAKQLPARLRALWDLYGWRVRQHPAQELMGAVGIAVGVALLFGVLLANVGVTGPAPSSCTSSPGTARYTLSARSSEGFDEGSSSPRSESLRTCRSPLRSCASRPRRGAEGSRTGRADRPHPDDRRVGRRSNPQPRRGRSAAGGGVGLPEEVARRVGRGGQPITILANGGAETVQLRVASDRRRSARWRVARSRSGCSAPSSASATREIGSARSS